MVKKVFKIYFLRGTESSAKDFKTSLDLKCLDDLGFKFTPLYFFSLGHVTIKNCNATVSSFDLKGVIGKILLLVAVELAYVGLQWRECIALEMLISVTPVSNFGKFENFVNSAIHS